jgi:hypothetical protein
MSQSDAEANRLMEQQRLGGEYEDVFSSRLADEDDEENLQDCPICLCSESIDGSMRCRNCGYRSDR